MVWFFPFLLAPSFSKEIYLEIHKAEAGRPLEQSAPADDGVCSHAEVKG